MTSAPTPLTHYSPGGGCACKLPQRLLDDVLTTLRPTTASCALDGDGAAPGRLRVGLDPADDAAVYDLPGLDGRSLVMTTDFLTPAVDDPYDWGRIAATNALSDVYAMGGRPLLALNLLAWPADLDKDLVADVLRGGAAAVRQAGALTAGGHSITDPAPKYGLALLGEVDRHAILRKGGGRPGDLLVLTKPLGVGVIGTASKRGDATSTQIQTAIDTMTRSNAAASRVATTAGLRSGTDVTGYGLLGHLHEMATAAALEARIWTDHVPFLPGGADLVTRGSAPDGSRRTLAGALDAGWFAPDGLDPTTQLLLADAQTSGGLLLAVAPESARSVVAALHSGGDHDAAAVGELLDGPAGHISVDRHSTRAL